MTHLEYIKGEAAKNMAFHMENMGCLQKDASVTLTFLFVVISATFSGAVKLYIANNIAMTISLSILCIYLSLLAAYLVFSCLMARSVEAPSNEPKNLALKEGYSSEDIQMFELENLQQRIDSNKRRNKQTAFHLNLVRWLICASPLIFLLGILITVAVMTVSGLA